MSKKGKGGDCTAAPSDFVAGGHDWTKERQELAAAGDEEGLRWLDGLLPHIKNEPALTVQDGVRLKRRVSVLRAEHVLDALLARGNALRLLTELRPVLRLGLDSPSQIFARWKSLADRVYLFESRASDGAKVAGLGKDLVPGSPALESPARQWVTALHETTRAMHPHARDSTEPSGVPDAPLDAVANDRVAWVGSRSEGPPLEIDCEPDQCCVVGQGEVEVRNARARRSCWFRCRLRRCQQIASRHPPTVHGEGQTKWANGRTAPSECDES